MNPNQIVEKILYSKKYRDYPKDFVKKIVLKFTCQVCGKSSQSSEGFRSKKAVFE